MKKLIVILLISVFVSGCAGKTSYEEDIQEDGRIVLVENYTNFDIVYDKYTKVMYSVSTGHYNYGNVTVLMDSDGKPLLYEGE